MAGGLEGKRILVVEDDYFIAADLKRALRGKGAEVVGPVGYLDEGLAIADADPVDAAILDINLGTSTTYAIADRLSERAVPFVFVTGYDSWSMPAAYKSKPRLAKPFSMPVVMETVGRLFSTEVRL